MNILTFDIEDWFHLLDYDETNDVTKWNDYPSRIDANLDRILHILNHANQSATFFCLGWIAEKYPHVIRRIVEHGHEIACHSYYHRLVYKQASSDFREDLRKSIDLISSISCQKIYAFRAPGFSLTSESLWMLDILLEEGISVDCSLFSGYRTHGGLTNLNINTPCILSTNSGNHIRELPLNFYDLFFLKLIFSGGGYFRLLPYFLLKLLFKNSKYSMAYFHPRDFDPYQPILSNLSLFRKFKSYVGLAYSEKKLINLLNDFEFIDIRTACKIINWNLHVSSK